MGNVEHTIHCVKSVRIRSYSGPHFPAFGLNTERYGCSVRMRENADENNSEYKYFLRSAGVKLITTTIATLIHDLIFAIRR